MKILIIEFYTEERTAATIIDSLYENNFEVSLLSSREYFNVVKNISNKKFNHLDLDFWDKNKLNKLKFDLTILLNPEFYKSQHIKLIIEFLKKNRFGIGVFNSKTFLDRNAPSINKWLIKNSSFVFISDYDFINKDNLLVKLFLKEGNKSIIIPFRHFVTEGISFCKLQKENLNIVVSGKIQRKRRKYLSSIFAFLVVKCITKKDIQFILNGKPVGIYGFMIILLALIINIFSRKKVIKFYTNNINENEYNDNLISSHINFLPLTSTYNYGKDCGAYYDGLIFGLINFTNKKYNNAVGSYLRDFTITFNNNLDMIKQLYNVVINYDFFYQNSINGYLKYKNNSLKNYLNYELEKIIQEPILIIKKNNSKKLKFGDLESDKNKNLHFINCFDFYYENNNIAQLGFRKSEGKNYFFSFFLKGLENNIKKEIFFKFFSNISFLPNCFIVKKNDLSFPVNIYKLRDLVNKGYISKNGDLIVNKDPFINNKLYNILKKLK